MQEKEFSLDKALYGARTHFLFCDIQKCVLKKKSRAWTNES
jgi:hypothetical protein